MQVVLVKADHFLACLAHHVGVADVALRRNLAVESPRARGALVNRSSRTRSPTRRSVVRTLSPVRLRFSGKSSRAKRCMYPARPCAEHVGPDLRPSRAEVGRNRF